MGVSPGVKMNSSVGAGDSMIGAMLWALCKGEDELTAFRWGLAAGAATAMTDGTEIGRKKDIERLFAEASYQRA